MAIKFGKVVSYFKELPSIKSHNSLNMQSHEVTGQVKQVVM